MRKSNLAIKEALDVLDPIMVDPKHCSLEHENNDVRVFRVKIEPKGKMAMHDHSDSVAVFLTDVLARFIYPDGNSDVFTAKAGDAKYMPSGRMAPENLTDNPIELIITELKI